MSGCIVTDDSIQTWQPMSKYQPVMKKNTTVVTCVLYLKKKNEQINKNLWVTLTPCLKTSRKEPNAGAIITSALGAKLTQHAFLSCSYILHGFKIKCNKIHLLLSKHTSSELNPRCKQRYSMKAKIKHLATCHLPNKVDENYVKCVGKVLLLLDQLSG